MSVHRCLAEPCLLILPLISMEIAKNLSDTDHGGADIFLDVLSFMPLKDTTAAPPSLRSATQPMWITQTLDGGSL